LADDARIAVLRAQVLLPPHIAEESDQKMDEMEALMTKEDRIVRQSLSDLARTPNLSADADLKAATASYAQFNEIRMQVLKHSRENTNVRSLTISLNQKRKVTLVCQDALTALRNAIEQEPITPAPVNPR
jgi:acyl-ACP thioesterase